MKKGPSRLARTLRSLVAMIALGAGLAVYNAVTVSRDVSTATGPKGEGQHEFFLAAADRPDIELFFKKLTPEQKATMAKRLGEYADPKLAKVIGKLLGTFDAPAREILTHSLTVSGEKDPEAVAAQLTQNGSLQRLAIGAALREIGSPALPAVVEQLKVKDARNNAVAYLVAIGKTSVPYLLPVLDSTDADVRLAAADALGKIAAPEGVAKLTQLYEKSSGDERFGYLSALSGIGSHDSEELLAKAVDDPALTGPQQAQAMLGLGRVGTSSAIHRLWTFAANEDPNLRDAAISALQLAGSASLSQATDPRLGLRVAAGLKEPAADDYIGMNLASRDLIKPAAEAAYGRPALVSSLSEVVRRTQDGDAVDAVLRSLGSTPKGLERLKGLENDPTLGGFAFRRLRLLGVRS